MIAASQGKGEARRGGAPRGGQGEADQRHTGPQGEEDEDLRPLRAHLDGRRPRLLVCRRPDRGDRVIVVFLPLFLAGLVIVVFLRVVFELCPEDTQRWSHLS